MEVKILKIGLKNSLRRKMFLIMILDLDVKFKTI